MWILLGLACGWLRSLSPPGPTADDAEVRLTRAGDLLATIGYCDPGDCFSIQVPVATEIDGERVEVAMFVGADQAVQLLDAGRLCARAQDIREADRPGALLADTTTYECGKQPGR